MGIDGVEIKRRKDRAAQIAARGQAKQPRTNQPEKEKQRTLNEDDKPTKSIKISPIFLGLIGFVFIVAAVISITQLGSNDSSLMEVGIFAAIGIFFLIALKRSSQKILAVEQAKRTDTSQDNEMHIFVEDASPTSSQRNYISGTILGSLVLGLIVIFFVIKPDSNTSTRSFFNNPENDAEVWAMMYVERRLKSPSTAKFVYSSIKATEIKPNVWQVIGKVDSQNGFGAMIRSNWYIELVSKQGCKDYGKSECWDVQSGPIFIK